MTPKSYVDRILRQFQHGPYTLEVLIEMAISDAIEACAKICDDIAADKHAQYKGRPPHAPGNEHRADPHTEGESDGADLCAAAIRATSASS